MSQSIPNALLIFGPPGSGKGTVGAKLAATTGIKHLSTGDIFRGLPASSPNGQLFYQYSNAGKLVPDEVTIAIFSRFLGGLIDTNRLDPSNDMLLLDGIPRTASQAELVKPVVNVRHLMVLEIQDEDVIVQRLLKRAKLEGRKDDADESIVRNRFVEYRNKTAAVLQCYDPSIVTLINGQGYPDEVFLATLDAYVKIRKSLQS